MSSYDGVVSPGTPAQTLELSAITMTKVAVDTKMSNNAYLLTCRQTGTQLLIDAAAEPETLLPLINAENLVAVVTTHRHWDHHRALAAVVEATGAEVWVGAADADAVTDQTGVEVDRRLEHGDKVSFGEVTLDVVAVRGHTPGSVCLVLEDADAGRHLWTGDSLFPGGVGNTFGDADAFVQLVTDVEERIFEVYDGGHFHPGHGNDSELNAERPHVSEWRSRGW